MVWGEACLASWRLFVMTCAGVNGYFAADNLENETICLVNTDAPPASKVAFKWLWFADAVVAVAINAFEQFVDALDGLLVARLPIGIFRPGSVVPDLFHAATLRRRFAARRDLVLGLALSPSTSTRSW